MERRETTLTSQYVSLLLVLKPWTLKIIAKPGAAQS